MGDSKTGKTSGLRPKVDPAIFSDASLRDMAQAVLYALGGPEGAASHLAPGPYLTLVACASLMVDETEDAERVS